MSSSRRLSFSTGRPAIDRTLRLIVDTLERRFPTTIRSYYLFGSFADGSAVDSSDIDLFIVVQGEVRDGLRQQITSEIRSLTTPAPVQVDLLVMSDRILIRDGHFRVKHASRLIFGEDIRGYLPEQTTGQWLRHYSEAPIAYSLRVLRNVERIAYPLAYPQPDSEFFGYDRNQLPPSGLPLHNVAAMVSAACWMGTLLVAMKTGEQARTKSESVRLYRSAVGDEWSGFLSGLYQHGKERWGYQVPASNEERLCLRSFCEKMLDFENHYFARFRGWLLEQAYSPDALNRRLAMEHFGLVLFHDDLVAEALRTGTQDEDAEVRRLSAKAQKRQR